MNIANTVLMVKPTHFGFNPETAESNHFQTRLKLGTKEIQQRAHEEFQGVVDTLEQHGIKVLILDSPNAYTPDAVFPNNWFTTHLLDNEQYIFLYPMLCPNRQKEVQKSELQALLKTTFPDSTYHVIDYRQSNSAILEGTGALIFDHGEKMAFMSFSERADTTLAKEITDRLGYELMTFHSFDKHEQPIYHTNVMMNIGEKLVFVCLEAIKPTIKRAAVHKKLEKMGKMIIELSLEQIYCMAGNVLELKNNKEQHFLLLSAVADQSLTTAQKNVIDQYCQRLPCDISTIETIGGGSVRCMLAEIFH